MSTSQANNYFGHDQLEHAERVHPGCTPEGHFLCCRRECSTVNAIFLYKGPSPFKKLQCSGCDHIMCKSCTHTEIIQPGGDELWETVEDIRDPHCWDVRVARYRGEPKVFEMCESCGLTYRAQTPFGHEKVFGSTTVRFRGLFMHLKNSCICGQPVMLTWPRMHINLTDDNRPFGPDGVAPKKGRLRALSRSLFYILRKNSE
ncbi:uncharacterized protein N0V89_012494 [Didymosphaeria variabile]|uniref:Probable double zinc ribbon domain-containing protein n=1 Tax=Didymosphaeria variabile TaxID=1932322 RepID=A0A9W8XA12_9PLEO|nr:uncharacterized protein N0V89_012494 [Didymosphaeria variabile]KAJ4344750.1 hypothetical protein N0V89_012494 [Didymosphaeria variabile]